MAFTFSKLATGNSSMSGSHVVFTDTYKYVCTLIRPSNLAQPAIRVPQGHSGRTMSKIWLRDSNILLQHCPTFRNEWLYKSIREGLRKLPKQQCDRKRCQATDSTALCTGSHKRDSTNSSVYSSLSMSLPARFLSIQLTDIFEIYCSIYLLLFLRTFANFCLEEKLQRYNSVKKVAEILNKSKVNYMIFLCKILLCYFKKNNG